MQFIAMVTMLLDHIGVVWFPGDSTWRMIGRLALPLYAYALVIGYLRTRNVNLYIWRMLAIAVISQIPYSLTFRTLEINTVGTLFICLLMLWALDKLKDKHALQVAIAAVTILLVELVPVSYGAYLPVLIIIYRYLPAGSMAPLHFALNVVFMFYKGWTVQLFSVLATLLLVYMPVFLRAVDRIRVPRVVWRSFYPLHLALIAAIDYSNLLEIR
ncbi:TraX family protein [Paenibacillus radicis (ex Gao et al. 2016)]|uniref:Fimbrial assembly protein fimC n=1 Tax=Paenibacillus radicis (ex Gao et al. 2016) TaxID=1737354 RepID=A0A917LYV7_9BACL|nr:TraX family protein [Paenibacillus radicis (ex Gao et al. 2016)]GGG66139.1 fimbrial assembly protein fimC [Paenibacillus radicis (ex Gao et al. 2016)]